MDEDGNKSIFYYISQIKQELIYIIEDINKYTKEDFYNDRHLQDSILFRMIQVGEIVGKIPQSFKDMYPEIPWAKMKAIRNRIVHGYGSVDLNVIYTVAKINLKEIYNELVQWEESHKSIREIKNKNI